MSSAKNMLNEYPKEVLFPVLEGIFTEIENTEGNDEKIKEFKDNLAEEVTELRELISKCEKNPEETLDIFSELKNRAGKVLEEYRKINQRKMYFYKD